MSNYSGNVADLIAMIAFKEALDVQMEILELEIDGIQNEQVKVKLTEELLRVTSENVKASSDILNMARELNVSVTDIDLID